MKNKMLYVQNNYIAIPTKLNFSSGIGVKTNKWLILKSLIFNKLAKLENRFKDRTNSMRF